MFKKKFVFITLIIFMLSLSVFANTITQKQTFFDLQKGSWWILDDNDHGQKKIEVTDQITQEGEKLKKITFYYLKNDEFLPFLAMIVYSDNNGIVLKGAEDLYENDDLPVKESRVLNQASQLDEPITIFFKDPVIGDIYKSKSDLNGKTIYGSVEVEGYEDISTQLGVFGCYKYLLRTTLPHRENVTSRIWINNSIGFVKIEFYHNGVYSQQVLQSYSLD